MSAEVLFAGIAARESVRQQEKSVPLATGWNPDHYAREQVRGLVRQVFLSSTERSVRQVVVSAVDPDSDVKNICRLVGEALALETTASIAVAGEYPRAVQDAGVINHAALDHAAGDGHTPLRQSATRIQRNLWLVPAIAKDKERGATSLVLSYLGEMRREFEYSVVEGPLAGDSNQATAMAQFADGVILVLSALHTRRVTARNIKEMLEGAQARILGTILSDRIFPIPESIYRRL
jgi:hypothetical protein